MESIAIIGMACRFPQAKNPEEFWKLLLEGIDTISEVPSKRWDAEAIDQPTPATQGKINTRWGGFLEKVDWFDPSFFRIAPQEAKRIDPQQRLFLEVAWEALEDAGIVPEKLRGSRTGVFVGISNSDYHRLLSRELSGITPYDNVGNSFAIVANRLSYILDCQGPSIAIDTTCSSSLVAVHYACQSLQCQESSLALVGGVNLILSPEVTIGCSLAGLIAEDGHCKTFDASADGFVRGEGCGVVILKRLADAKRDGDNILAIIRGSAVNQDGLTNGLTAPNGPSQQAVMRRALENAEVAPAEISYVEAHAVGTPMGDAIEVKSLKSVLMEGRKPSQPCWIGSVKTNIGHLEAASGIAGLIKVVLQMQNKNIAPHLHLKQLNPYIRINNTPLSIPTVSQKWPDLQAPRLAGVNSFGIGGTNAHVILEEAPVPVKSEDFRERPCHIFTLSAKCDQALQELSQRYQEFLGNNSTASIADICFTTNIGRTHFDHRLAIVAESTVQLREHLKAFATGTETPGVISTKVTSKKSPKIAFLFTDQGGQYIDMGRQLYETQSTFRQTLDLCDEILRPYLAQPLLSFLDAEPGETSPIDKPTLFSLEYALAQLWQSWGIAPDAVMGCGVGEYVAACVAGVFSLEAGLKLMVNRESLGESSPLQLISNVTGDLATAEMGTPQYRESNRQVSLVVADSMESLKNNGCQLFVEIGSQSNSWDLSRQCLPEGMGMYLPSMQQGQSPWPQLLQTLAQLYLRGVKVDWSEFDRDYPRSRIQLPTYPFQRQRHWFKTATLNPQSSTSSDQTVNTRQIPPLFSQGEKAVPTTQISPPCMKINLDPSPFPPVPTSIFKRDNVESIQNWIVDWLVKKLNLEATAIDASKSLVDYGLDSLGAMELAQELGYWLGHSLNPTLLWDFPTIESLASHLPSELNLPASVENKTINTDTPSFNDNLLHGNPSEPLPPPRGIIARIAIWLFGVISRFIWHIEVTGIEYVPKSGPFILTPNHESHFDSLWISSYLPPSLRYSFCCLAKQEHFERLTTRLFASLVGGIPVNRQGDALPALRTAAKALSAQQSLLIHPEGTRTRTGTLLPFHRGPAKLAIATGVPLIPVRIIGAYDIFPPHRKLPSFFDWKRLQRRPLQIIFGKPILPPKDEEGWALETRLTEQLRSAVESLGLAE
ncbi:MAG: acyltransferase domain-containing protein [Symploca sp. SIO1A3]|nr:acyltransferase domain-containing protein [Symploca sp. SIO1A3]